jgi:hypothetical protein
MLLIGLTASALGAFDAAHLLADEDADLDQQLLEQLGEADEADLLDENADSDAAPAKKSVDPAAERRKTDEDLLDQFDVDDDLGEAAGEYIPLPRDGAVPADRLGEDVDPLTRIGHKMRQAEILVPEKTELQRAAKLQEEIAADLAELIKQIQQQQKQQQQSQSSSSQQQASRSKPKLNPRQQQPKPDRQNSKKPSNESQERQGKAEPEFDVAKWNDDIIKDWWGHLPEKERERLRQLSAEEIMTQYQVQIEKYFRRMSEAENQLR